MSRSRLLACLLAVLALTASLAFTSSASAVQIAQDRVVSAVPSANTPHARDGAVQVITQVGSTMVIGGTFTSVTEPAGWPARALPYILAFDAATGAIRTSFAPTLNGPVNSLWPGPIPNTVYVGGGFSTIGGTASPKVALLDLATGQRVPGFRAAALNGVVNSVQRLGNRLFVGGAFTTVGGVAHGGIATLNALTGAVDPFVSSTVSVNHNWTPTNGAAKAPIMVRALDITPDGSKLIALGNFKKVDGLDRDQVVMFDLTGPTAVVRANWRTRSYEPACAYRAFDSWVRDVQFSPDGEYFVIVTTGAPGGTLLCDTAARFETGGTGDAVTPTWVDYTGGDSLYAVSITGTAVYIGGHMRWLNNPSGRDSAGPGAVPRPGVGALDPLTGLPLKWNPGRNPRGVGVQALYATADGLWMGSDTAYVGNRLYKRQRIAFFPLVGADAPPARMAARLPGNIYLGGAAVSPTGLMKRSYNGSSIGGLTSVASPLNWSTVRGVVEIDGTLFYGKTDGMLYKRTFDGTVFGAEEKVDPYLDPLWAGVPTGSGDTVFTGVRPSFYSEIPSLSSMFYDPVTSRLYYTLAGNGGLYYRIFSPESGVIGASRIQVSGASLPSLSGAFLDSGNFYYASVTTGRLYRAAWNNGAPGTGVQISGPDSADRIDWRAKSLFLAR